MAAFIMWVLLFHGGHDHVKPEAKITGTKVFQPFRQDEVLVLENGDVYLVNFQGAQILHYDEDGKMIATIGQKGQGPGEFVYPTQIFSDGTRLFIKDMGAARVTVMDLDGKLIETLRMPSPFLDMLHTPNGWFYGTWSQAPDPDAPSELYFADPTLKDLKKVLTLPASGQSGAVISGMTGHVYFPLASQPNLVSSPDGKEVYVSDPVVFKITVLDAANGNVLREITRNDKPVQMDQEWLDFKVKNMKKKRARMGIMDPLSVQVPENFPIIREMKFDPDGNLVVNKWMGNPEVNFNLVAYNQKGKEVTSKYSWPVLSRIMGTHEKTFAFISFYDPTIDEAGLAKVPLAKAEKFVKENPIIYDDSVSRTIVVHDDN